MVFRYYTLNTTSYTTAIEYIRDKLVTEGWIIDKDDVINSNTIIFHKPNTNCYFRLNTYSSPRFPTTGYISTTIGDGFNGTDITYSWNVLARTYLSNSLYTSGFFNIRKIDLFVNDSFFILFFIGDLRYIYASTDKTFYDIFLPTFAGQIQTDDNLYSNFLWGVTNGDVGYDTGTRFSSTSGGYYIYRGNFITNIFKCFPYFNYRFNHSLLSLSYLSPLGRTDDIYINIDGLNYFRFPYNFGKWFMHSAPITVNYTENNIDYFFPIGELPFYFVTVTGSDLRRVINYNGRKFMLMPLIFTPYKTTGKYYGVAIECNNI